MSLWTGDIHVGTGITLPRKPNTETESVKSCNSEQSSRSRRSRAHSTHGSGGHQSHRNHVSKRSHRSPRSDRIYHSALSGKYGNGNDSRPEGDVIEVQILSQDDNWGDNTTAITGNTSDRSVSFEDVSKLNGDYESGLQFYCHMWVGTVVAAILFLCAFASPIVMVILPKIEALQWEVKHCGPECDGLLISLAFKLLILLVATWAVFIRRPQVTLPRIFIFRATVLAFVIVFTFAFWLFYAVRIIEKRHDDYHSIVLFAVSHVDTLLYIHYLTVTLVIILPLQPMYFVKVVRSPDGESHCYTMGQLSIQRAAAWVLDQYYKDFSIYNPYLETIPTKSRKPSTGFKMYDVDGIGNNGLNCPRTPLGNDINRRDSSHNELYYEEHEYERRVRKRRARLISAAEESFTHIKRLQDEQGPAIPMDPFEAAQAIFPSMAKSLQKYLRLTRQQPRHTMQSILDHLALCLSHDLSPKVFLEKYIIHKPVLQNDQEHKRNQTWALICDTLLSRAVEPGCIFTLRQNDISLLVSVHRLPHFSIIEEIIDPKSNKFVLRLNSETSV